MACSQTCSSFDGLFRYVFVEDSQLNHQLARRSCIDRNGTLATNLTLEDYRNIDSCCTSPKTFRIGLVKRTDICPDSEAKYSWFSSSSCENGSPLQISGVVPNTCQAVAIQAGNIQANNFAVNLSNCFEKLPYICQIKNPSTLPNKLLEDDPPNSFFRESSTSAGTTAGIAIACLLTLMIILFLVFLHFRKQNKKNQESNGMMCRKEWCFSSTKNDKKAQKNINNAVNSHHPPVQHYENISDEGFGKNTDHTIRLQNTGVYENVSELSDVHHNDSAKLSKEALRTEDIRSSYENIDLNNSTSRSTQERSFAQQHNETYEFHIKNQTKPEEHSLDQSKAETSKDRKASSNHSKAETNKKRSGTATRALYAMVNKKSKRTSAPKTSDLYTVVDKSHKKQKQSNSEKDS